LIERIDYYDLLGVVIPGVLLSYWTAICFPEISEVAASAALPDAVDVIGFGAVAIFLGHIVQAIASALEEPLHRSWGGRPSMRALSGGLGERYISKEAGERICKGLVSVAGEGASHQDLFRIALNRANAAPASRSEKFNALYGYHRSLLVVVAIGWLLLVASRSWGAAATWSDGAFWAAAIAFTVTFLLLWHRTRQRAYHFVQETLYVAEQTLESASASSTSTKAT
jgi:hypothetical protein